MKCLMALFVLVQVITIAKNSLAQAIYGPQGQYQGYSQTSPSGVANVYNANGQNVQSFQTDNCQTNFYSPQGQYQGTTTAPVTPAPNTSINVPRQAPLAPTVKGW